MKTWWRASGIAVLLALPALGDDWGQLGRDDARQRLPGETVLAPAALGSGVVVGAQVAGSPVVADGYLVVADLDGNVRAYRESDRTLVWTRATGGPILSTPAVSQGRVVVSTGAGELRMFRLADGVPIWTTATATADQSSPVVTGGAIYLGSGFPVPGARALNATNGNPLWTTALDQITSQSVAIDSGRVYIGSNGGTLYALDASTGSPVWTYATGGTGGPSSPMVDGSSIYVVSDGSLQRVDVNDANWGSANWSVPILDPAPVAGAVDVEWAASSPAMAGGLIVFIARFSYGMDDLPLPPDGGPDGYADRRELREYVFAVDPTAKAVAWKVPLGSASVPDLNGIPPYRLCPSPVATGPGSVGIASSVEPLVRIVSLVNGSTLTSFVSDVPFLASPILANARIYAVSRAGTLYAYEDPTHPQPVAVTGLSPDGVELNATPATLSWSASPAPGASYVVRIARDGEFLMDSDYEFVTSNTSIPCPTPLDEVGSTYAWGVRVFDSSNAYGPWTTATFTINIPPAPPSNFTAVGKHGKAILNWTASPTPNTAGYLLSYGPTGGPAGPATNVGNVTTATVKGLTNGVSYTFVLRALDSDGDQSSAVTASATPTSLITLHGITYDNLNSAAAAAVSGDTILLGADTFDLSGTLTLQPGVSLQGINAHVSRIEATARFVMVKAMGGNSILLVTLAMGSTGVEAAGTNILVRNCILRDMTQYGVSAPGSAQVINNTIVNNFVAGIQSSGGGVNARNNIVQSNGVGLSGAVESSYNDVSDGYQGCSAGHGDLSQLVGFLDPASGDYREAAAQASLDTGRPQDDFSHEPAPNGHRVNLGAFGNTSLAATSTSPPPPRSGSVASCGLLGLEVLLLALLRRRRR